MHHCLRRNGYFYVMYTHTFNKEASGWYIDLPEYIAAGGSKADLAMVDGADTMLDIIAEGASSVRLDFDDKEFVGSDKLVLIEKCDPYIGGGNYIMPQWEGRSLDQRLWLCGVTEFVFGYIPEAIFVKRRSLSI